MTSVSPPWLLLCLILTACTQTSVREKTTKLPDFADYPAKRVFRGQPAEVDLTSHPDAKQSASPLREGTAQGPNFAGRYVVVESGCGTNCQTLAVVDAESGRVFFPGVTTVVGSSYRLESDLLIADPPEHWREAFGDEIPPVFRAMTYYYRWSGSQFLLLDSVDVRQVIGE